MNVRPTPFERLIAVLAILQGLFFATGPFLLPLLAGAPQLVLSVMGIVVLLGILTTLGGVIALLGKPWAFWLITAMFMLQSVEYLSESFSVTFFGPFSIKFGFGWEKPPSMLNFNLVAIAIWVAAARAASRLARARRRAENESELAQRAVRTQLSASMSQQGPDGIESRLATITEDEGGYRLIINTDARGAQTEAVNELRSTMSEIATFLEQHTDFRLADFRA